MRWKITKAPWQIAQERKQWKRVFLWFPTYIRSIRSFVWLEYVQKREIYNPGSINCDGDRIWITEYKIENRK